MMELTSVVFIILVSLCGVRDVHADTNLAAFSRKLNLLDRTIQAWKGTVVDLGIEMSNNFDLLELSLEEELTNKFIPALIKPLVKQAITGILKEEYVCNIISGRVLDVVNSLKTRVHTTKTQLRSVKRKFRLVKRERDSYKESLGKLRGELTKEIHRDIQGIQQRIQELEERDALREKHIQDLTEQKQKASSDPSRDRSHRERTAQMMTVTTHATSAPSRNGSHRERAEQITVTKSDLHASSDSSRTERTPVTTTKKPATQATPSPADCDVLMDASRRGNLEEMKRLLTLNVDVNCRDSDSRTPVMWAAGFGHGEVVELLVRKGADVSLVDEDGSSILHFACYAGDMEMVKFVLSLNVLDIESRGALSRTPVMYAARWGHRDVLELLVSIGADVSLVDDDGDNILHLVGWGGDMETAKFVLSLNVVDIDARNNDGRTAADVARSGRRRQIADLLESRGAQ
ncbi:ankyrin repeat domain-containing protein 1-like isoform X1 [Haliotis rufescens]|uniref:ankyrin repeat domain-containing protein 1-like isoform X1 n=1 Tax=Haliotis rufescens TaxID=6454 RepID=UPI00201F65A6|nr:ankyrin repeat domain-containing protein 1-like isoform X1 [Haliotis rufescens]